MKEKWNELKEYLEGLGTQMPEPFFRLAEILQLQVFELYQDPADGQYRVPYMMNDALEYFLILKNAAMTGKFEPEQTVTFGQLFRESNRYTLILHQENGNIFTLHFDDLQEHAQCYQYHRIGHFWVKGQEHWRQAERV